MQPSEIQGRKEIGLKLILVGGMQCQSSLSQSGGGSGCLVRPALLRPFQKGNDRRGADTACLIQGRITPPAGHGGQVVSTVS